MHWGLMTERRKKCCGRASRRSERKQEVVSGPPAVSARASTRTHLIWGPQDHYMPEDSARAYLRDLPDAELHLLDDGHWLLLRPRCLSGPYSSEIGRAHG